MRTIVRILVAFGLFVGAYFGAVFGSHLVTFKTTSGFIRKSEMEQKFPEKIVNSNFYVLLSDISDDAKVSVWAPPRRNGFWAVYVYGGHAGILLTNRGAKYIVSDIEEFSECGPGIWMIPTQVSATKTDIEWLFIDGVEWERL